MRTGNSDILYLELRVIADYGLTMSRKVPEKVIKYSAPVDV